MASLCQAKAAEPRHQHKAQVVATHRREENTDASLPHGEDRNPQDPEQQPKADGDSAPLPPQYTASQSAHETLQRDGHGADRKCELRKNRHNARKQRGADHMMHAFFFHVEEASFPCFIN